MTDIAGSTGKKKAATMDTIIGSAQNAITDPATAVTQSGDKKKKGKSIMGNFGGTAEQLGG